jgi:polyether ionophore transport system permease protein
VSSLKGTGALIRSVVRRDRVRLSVWVLGIGLTVLGSVASFPNAYPTAADRQARADVLDTPTTFLFVGRNYAPDNYTYGAMTAHEMLPLTAVAVALMSIFLVVRFTRAEEESGRTDLVRATAVGHSAPTAAALAVVGGANLALFALLAIGLPASLDELSARGSVAFAAAVTSIGFVFAGVAALVAQFTVAARTALGMASVLMGGAYLVRALGDMGGGTLTWLSPFGWADATRAYVDERWWPLLFSAVLTAALLGVAFGIDARRDVGTGLLADRPGPAVATPRLGTPFGLAFRLQRITLFWWTLSLLLLGLVYGSVAGSAGELYQKVDSINKYLARIGAADAIDQFLALTVFISALIAAGYAIQSALRPRGEETAGRAETVLTTPVSRSRFVGSHLAMSLGGSALLMLAFGVGVGLSRSIDTGDIDNLWRLTGAALTYTPALWVFAGLATALFGLAPKATSVVWAVLGALVFVGFFGPLLELPDWVYDLSPIEHIPRAPVADFTIAPLLVLTAVAAGLLVLGLAGFRRRDVEYR